MNKIFRIAFDWLRSDNRKSKTCPELCRRIENRKLAGIVAIVLALALVGARIEAQQPAKVSRIGYLGLSFPSANVARIEALRQGLRDLGYIEGENIVFEWRWAEGKAERIPELAAELVKLKVDIIVTGGSTATRAAKKATVTIPIVMSQDSDPVGSGFVASLAKPGGNITGLSSYAAELSGKRLELLKEVLPRLSRVAVLGNSTAPQNARALKDTELAADALGMKLQYLDVLGPKDIETAFRAASNGRAEGLLALNSFVVSAHRKQIIDPTVKTRLPAVYGQPEFMEIGGLVYYGASYTDLFRRAATYVDKILKGTKPADLPVEQPKKFEFIINLKAAKQIGLTIPPNVLMRADRVIR
jgi:putative tryptophan/tyrosine transport system substrate-binding protein